ncbi:LysR family transcriptional regulator, partial [Pseudomonas aeruginosa]|uniref:LysR family transcriptional regulator n=1 Tax=Pseudomonas aeruginosa TaxID=287 RepID=UPI001F09F53C
MPIHNLNHVNMFLQVIASGSISSAARILRKSHTAVSSAVSNLEIDLCVELVRRDGYKVEPTEQALRLIPYMRSLLNYQQLIGDIAFNLNKGPRNLRVLLDTAIPPSFCDTVSSVLLDDFNMVSLIRTQCHQLKPPALAGARNPGAWTRGAAVPSLVLLPSSAHVRPRRQLNGCRFASAGGISRFPGARVPAAVWPA